MTQYAALIYSRRRRLDRRPSTPARPRECSDVRARRPRAVIRGGAALYPTSTATTVRVERQGRRRR